MARTCDIGLCCTGSYPALIWYIVIPFNWLLPAFRDSSGSTGLLKLVRLLRILDLASLITTPIGILLLRKRKRETKVPRGCDGCRGCCGRWAYPPWSLLVQLLGVIGLLFSVSMSSEPVNTGQDIVWIVATFLLVPLEFLYGVLWLHALHRQDGTICCKAPGDDNETSTSMATVVGHPVCVDDPKFDVSKE